VSIRWRNSGDFAALVDALALVATADDYPGRWPHARLHRYSHGFHDEGLA
jgi:hypothetical protein